MGADLGFGADAFGGGEGRLEQLFELPGHSAAGAGDSIGLFHLAEDLRLADNHGVEAGGDAEEMAHGLAIAVLVDVGRECGAIEAEVIQKKADKLIARIGARVGADSVDCGQNLNAVAGGDDHAFLHAGDGGEQARHFGQVVAADGDALAQLNGSGFVVHADEGQGHGAPYLCTWLTRLLAQTKSMTTTTTPESQAALRPRRPALRRTSSSRT